MDRITLQSVLPDVFAQMPDLHSEVWLQNITFHKGKKYLIEAESGRGKSSLCHYIIGYRDDYSGMILFDHSDIRSLGERQWNDIRNFSISHLFQELRLFPELTAWENVVLKNNLTQHLTSKQIHEYFERLEIKDKKHTLCGQMSFGQQQRVAAIRSLAQPFDFLIIDEPISHLDDSNAQILGKLIVEVVDKQGAALITTSIGKHLDIKYDNTIKL